MHRTQIREVAIRCVYQSLLLKKDIYDVINNQDDVEEIKSDIFFLNITVNVFEHLQYLIAKISENLTNWEFERLSYLDQAILLVASAELLSENEDKAVIIDEAVKYSKKYSDEKAYKYINGVLDKL